LAGKRKDIWWRNHMRRDNLEDLYVNGTINISMNLKINKKG